MACLFHAYEKSYRNTSMRESTMCKSTEWPKNETSWYENIIARNFNSLRPSDAYMRQLTNHHWFR